MKHQHRTGAAVAALSAAALLGGGAAYAATQITEPADAPPTAASATAVATTDRQGMSSRGMRMGSGMGSFTEDQPFDAQFLDQMTMHHQGAIMSTRAMIADSDRPELRALAEDIVTSQQEQVVQMRAWREKWYPDLEATFGMAGGMMSGGMMNGGMMNGATNGQSPMGRGNAESEVPRPMMSGGMMSGGMMNGPTMRSMMGGDVGTERMYLRMMIGHHRLGVDMAQRAQQDAVHPELKDLAATIAAEQAAQIEQMRDYLRAAPESAGG